MKERVARLQGPSESRARCKPAARRRANMAPEPRARTAVASAGPSRYRRGQFFAQRHGLPCEAGWYRAQAPLGRRGVFFWPPARNAGGIFHGEKGHVLHHHAHLLPQRQHAHRPHLHHRGRGHDDALQKAAWLRRLFPHRHGRARPEDRAQGRAGRQDAQGVCR